jgi:ribosomal protein L19E
MKKVFIVLLVAILAVVIVSFPRTIAASSSYGEALSNYKNVILGLNSELEKVKGLSEQVRSLSKETYALVKEKKESGADLSAVEEYLKELKSIRKGVERRIDIRKARLGFARDKFEEFKDLRSLIKEMKEKGASKEELEPLVRRAKGKFKEMRNAMPFSPLKMSKNSDKMISEAEKLKNDGKEDAAIQLLDGVTKKVQGAVEVLKKQKENINKVIELLNKIKAGLS